MRKATLQPTHEDTWLVVYDPESYGSGYEQVLKQTFDQESMGDIEGACNARYRAFQNIAELIPEEGGIVLEWNDVTSRSAMTVISFSAIDHFLAGDFEMCAAMLEMLLDLDPEDHLQATERLAYCYVALEEWELFDEVINDITDHSPEKGVLKLWCEFRRDGAFNPGELAHFKKNFPEYYEEFTSDKHPATQEYLAAMDSERPPRKILARNLWLQTEHLWAQFPDFIEALGKS